MNEFINHLWNVNLPLFTIPWFNYPMSFIELVGTIFNLWCVWLVARNNVWNWPIGQVGVVAFLIMFWQIQLYSDFVEQIYFFITGFWGWYLWLNPKGAKDVNGQRPIAVTKNVEKLVYLVAIVLGTILLAEATIRFPSWLPKFFPEPASFPYIDAVTTIMSFAATILMARRQVECWVLWIAVDLIDIPLYWVKGVKFVCLLYCIFLFLAIRGLVRWYKEYQASKADEDGEYSCPGSCD